MHNASTKFCVETGIEKTVFRRYFFPPGAPMPLTASEIAGSRTSLTVHARNFKTRDTEKQIEKSVPDSDELNSKVQEYVDTIKVSFRSCHRQQPCIKAACKPLRCAVLPSETSTVMPEPCLSMNLIGR